MILVADESVDQPIVEANDVLAHDGIDGYITIGKGCP